MSVAAPQQVTQEKVAQTRLWALPLAFAIAGVCRRPSRTQLRLVGEWILPDVSWQTLSWWTRYQFHRALRSLSRTAIQLPHHRQIGVFSFVVQLSPRTLSKVLQFGLCAKSEILGFGELLS